MNYLNLEKRLLTLQADAVDPFNLIAAIYFDDYGRAIGQFFRSRLCSVFQIIREGHSLNPVAHEAYVRSFSSDDTGLHIWKLLEHAANDEESIALDRLCRLLHTINYFQQTEFARGDLYLSVHNRLLTAVSGNHGASF